MQLWSHFKDTLTVSKNGLFFPSYLCSVCAVLSVQHLGIALNCAQALTHPSTIFILQSLSAFKKKKCIFLWQCVSSPHKKRDTEFILSKYFWSEIVNKLEWTYNIMFKQIAMKAGANMSVSYVAPEFKDRFLSLNSLTRWEIHERLRGWLYPCYSTVGRRHAPYPHRAQHVLELSGETHLQRGNRVCVRELVRRTRRGSTSVHIESNGRKNSFRNY